MDGTENPKDMSTGIARVMESARKNPHRRLRSLAHYLDVEVLRLGCNEPSVTRTNGVVATDIFRSLHSTWRWCVVSGDTSTALGSMGIFEVCPSSCSTHTEPGTNG